MEDGNYILYYKWSLSNKIQERAVNICYTVSSCRRKSHKKDRMLSKAV